MTSRVFSYLKKATHVFVIASYLFHGVVPAIATRMKFDEVEGRQQKVSSIDALHATILRERQREETIRQEQKHEEPYDGRHPCFTPRATFDESEYTLKVQSIPHTTYDNTSYQVELMLSKKDGISMKVEEPRPGTGGRHREIHKELKTQDPSLEPRDALAESIKRARVVYKKDGLGNEIRSSLQKVIQQNKEKHTQLFKKKYK